ncbi:hypothetical protein ACI782_05805 [Geodermatophilus sp. SYSU D00703]
MSLRVPGSCLVASGARPRRRRARRAGRGPQPGRFLTIAGVVLLLLAPALALLSTPSAAASGIVLQAPGETTTPPTVTTAPPTVTTAPPTVTTAPPTVTTAPSTVTTAPSTVTTAPSTVTTAPSTVTTAPSTVTTAPSTVTTAPPTVTTAPPTVTTAPPTVTTAPPTVTTAPPTVTTTPQNPVAAAVTLTQQTTTSRIGQPVLITATVPPGAAQSVVVFSMAGAGPALTRRDDTAADGFTASFVREQEGTDTIRATVTTPEGGRATAADIEHVWTAEPSAAVVVSPAGASSCTGSRFTASVSVTGDDGAPRVGVPVRLSLGPGSSEGALTGTTGTGGRAALGFTRTAPGEQTLLATADLPTGPVTSAPTPLVWVDCGIALALAPAGTTSPAGVLFTATVHVTDGVGEPLGGAQVAWNVTTDGGQPEIPVVTANGQGLASWTWTRDNPGTDRIAVTVTHGGRTGQATTDHFWTGASDAQLRLAPAGTESLAGSPFTVTALVTDDGLPVAGVVVRFRASLAPVGADDVVVPGGAADEVGEAVTRELGLASFEILREVAGTDTVVAEAEVDGEPVSNSVVHLWTLVPGLEFTLAPAGTSGPPGTDATVTATVYDDDEPPAEAEVAFRATMDGEQELTETVPVDEDGRATFTWTRDVAGPEQVEATVTLDDGPQGAASVARLWLDEDGQALPPPPPPPDFDVDGGQVPGGPVVVNGTGCPPGAEVTADLDGERVATTRADANGDYRLRIGLPAEVDRYELRTGCLPVQVVQHVDVVVPTASSRTAGAAATTSMAVFGFFVLLGGQLLRLSDH